MPGEREKCDEDQQQQPFLIVSCLGARLISGEASFQPFLPPPPSPGSLERDTFLPVVVGAGADADAWFPRKPFYSQFDPIS